MYTHDIIHKYTIFYMHIYVNAIYYYKPCTVMCRVVSHPLCPRVPADIAGHPVTSRDKSYLRGVLGRLLNENIGQVGNAQNN